TCFSILHYTTLSIYEIYTLSLHDALPILSTAEIGSVIIFPGTMSVIIFGYIGGILVDRRGPLYVLNIGVTFLSVSFLTASFLLETTSWFMTIIIVFVLGGLSFTKTV